MSDKNINVKFEIQCKETQFGEDLYIIGNSNELGNWNVNQSQKLKTDSSKFPLWETDNIKFKKKSPLEYKYIIKNNSNNVRWENFDGNRNLNLSSLQNDYYIIDDGEFNNKLNQTINKSTGETIQINSNSNSPKKNKSHHEKKHNNNNYQYINTNADEYVKSRREEIKDIQIPEFDFQSDGKKIDKEIEDFINTLKQKNEEKKTWREKLSCVCELITENYNSEEIISLIAAYLYFINSGQIKCSEDGTHFRPNHSAKQAFNIFSHLYKNIYHNSESINISAFSIIAQSILKNLPSFNEQFMVAVPLTRIRDIAHRNDIPHDLKQEIKHKLQNKLHRNASPDDLIVCEYFIEKIKNADYSEAFKNEFYIFYEELKEFFNSSGLDSLLIKFQEICKEYESETQKIIDVLKDNDLVKKIESIVLFRENICSKIIKKEINSEDDTHKTILQTTSNLDIELDNKLFVIISEYINNLTKNININKFEINYFKNLLKLFDLCLKNLEISEIASQSAKTLKSDFDYFSGAINNLNRFVMLQIKSIIERGNNISIEICSHLEHLFNPNNLLFLGSKLNINKRSVLVFVESFIRSNMVFQFSKCCDLLMTIIRDYLNLPPYNIINKGSVEGQFYYFENIDLYNKENIEDKNEKILFIDNSDGTEEIPENVTGVILNQDLSQLSHLSIRVRQHGAAFCCVLDQKIFKDYINKFKNKDLVAFECLNESKINIHKIDKLSKKTQKNEKEEDNNEKSNDNNNDNIEEKTEEKNLLTFTVKDKEIEKTGSKFEKIKNLYDVSENSDLFTTPFAICIPSNIYDKYLTLFLSEHENDFTNLEKCELKDLDIQSENFRNSFVNYIINLYNNEDEDLKTIIETITSNFNSLSSNNNLLAIRSSSNLEDNKNQAGAGLFDSYLNIELTNKENIIKHIGKVWASVFNSRAIINRRKLNIETKLAKMSVIIMQMTEPEFCYVIHTINPINGNKNEVYIELAIGLGETLASSDQKGAPYRLLYHRNEDKVDIINLSSFNYELERKTNNKKLISYKDIELSKSEDFITEVGKRLGKIGIDIEEKIGKENNGEDIEGNFVKAQDIEGNYSANNYYIVQTRPEIV